jgi:hypothetical protein
VASSESVPKSADPSHFFTLKNIVLLAQLPRLSTHIFYNLEPLGVQRRRSLFISRLSAACSCAWYIAKMQQTPRAARHLLGSSGIRKVAHSARSQFASAAEFSSWLRLADVACTARPAAAVGVGAARAATTAAAPSAPAAAGGTQRQLGMPAPNNSKTYATASAPPPPMVLVKVGDGKDSLFKGPAGADVAAMDRMTLLEALAASKGFGGSLTGVNLDKCTVRVVTSASMEEPSAAEEAAAVELKGGTALAEHAAAGMHLFVRVALPAPPPTATHGTCGCHGAVCLLREDFCYLAADCRFVAVRYVAPPERIPTTWFLVVSRGFASSASSASHEAHKTSR